LQASQRDGTVIGSFTAMGFRGWVNSMRGDLAAAELDLTTAFHQAEDAGLTMADATGLFFLQDAMLERPTLGWAADLAERTVLDPIFDRTWSGGMVRQARAPVRLARRDFEGAVTDLRAVGEVAKALRIGPSFSLWRSVLALALPADPREEARQLVAEERELARAAGLRRATGGALRAAGILEGGARGPGRRVSPGVERADRPRRVVASCPGQARRRPQARCGWWSHRSGSRSSLSLG
jgi:hypothetical protein